jgi:hypothetical protein
VRTIGAMLAMVLALVASAASAAPVFADPAGLVRYAYEAYANGDAAGIDLMELYSPSLQALFDADEARTMEGDIGALDFDPFVNGQDHELTELEVIEAITNGDQSLVAVSFYNFGDFNQLMFTLVHRAEGWKIDDIESVQPGSEWRLSEILAADPMLN